MKIEIEQWETLTCTRSRAQAGKGKVWTKEGTQIRGEQRHETNLVGRGDGTTFIYERHMYKE